MIAQDITVEMLSSALGRCFVHHPDAALIVVVDEMVDDVVLRQWPVLPDGTLGGPLREDEVQPFVAYYVLDTRDGDVIGHYDDLRDATTSAENLAEDRREAVTVLQMRWLAGRREAEEVFVVLPNGTLETRESDDGQYRPVMNADEFVSRHALPEVLYVASVTVDTDDGSSVAALRAALDTVPGASTEIMDIMDSPGFAAAQIMVLARGVEAAGTEAIRRLGMVPLLVEAVVDDVQEASEVAPPVAYYVLVTTTPEGDYRYPADGFLADTSEPGWPIYTDEDAAIEDASAVAVAERWDCGLVYRDCNGAATLIARVYADGSIYSEGGAGRAVRVRAGKTDDAATRRAALKVLPDDAVLAIAHHAADGPVRAEAVAECANRRISSRLWRMGEGSRPVTITVPAWVAQGLGGLVDFANPNSDNDAEAQAAEALRVTLAAFAAATDATA